MTSQSFNENNPGSFTELFFTASFGNYFGAYDTNELWVNEGNEQGAGTDGFEGYGSDSESNEGFGSDNGVFVDVEEEYIGVNSIPLVSVNEAMIDTNLGDSEGEDSDYALSYDLCSLHSSDEEDSVSYPSFIPHLKLGMLFYSADDFREAVRQYSVIKKKILHLCQMRSRRLGLHAKGKNNRLNQLYDLIALFHFNLCDITKQEVAQMQLKMQH